MNLTSENIQLLSQDEFRLNNLFYIRNKLGKKVPFVMNDTQKKLEQSDSRYNMTLKSRQQGVSTYYILKYLNRVMFRRNHVAGIIAHDKKSIVKLFEIVHYAYKHFAIPSILPEIGKGGGSKYEMKFPTLDSKIFVALEVRSESVNDLHVSEYGFMKKDRFDASVDAVNTENGQISIESTANGINHFHTDWNDPESIFEKHFFPWFVHAENKMSFQDGQKEIDPRHEERQLKIYAKSFDIELSDDQIRWRRHKIKEKNSQDKFFQEHPENDQECFLSSGSPAMNLKIVSQLIKNAANKKLDSEDGDICIYHEAERGNKYIVGVDMAEGIGSDYSVATVIQQSPFRVCAKFRCKDLTPKKFIEKAVDDLINKYRVAYHDPLVDIERNNHGHTALLVLEEICKYPNIYEFTDERVGWLTSKATRPVLVDDCIEAIQDELIECYDLDTLNECMTLIDNNGKVEAQEGFHDDSFISLGIAIQVATRYYDGSLLDYLLEG